MTSKARYGLAVRSLFVTLTLSITVILALSGWTLELTNPVPSAADELLRHVQYLASDELMGRGVDTPGIKRARDYIAAEFRKDGLKAGGDNESYFQAFSVVTGVDVKQPSKLELGQRNALTINDDWIPLGLSASAAAEAEVVFAGYGITAKDYGYDDYAGIDVRNKIVLVLRYEPPPKDGKSPFRSSPAYSTHSALRIKASNARDHGAIGMILVDLTNGDGKTELLSTRSSLWRGGSSLIAAQIKRRVAEQWLGEYGLSLQGMKDKIDREGKPSSIPLPGGKIDLQVTLEELRQSTDNVVGMLPGTNPVLKNEYVVIGAHYDHLGLGEYGAMNPLAQGQIHHGADDNASGTAVLLDLARRLSQLNAKPARSIVFVTFSGEELGLYGSRHFVQHSPTATATKAMLNLDMVGRLRDDRLTVFGTRSGEKLSAVVNSAAHTLNLEVTESDDVGRSDHMSFYSRKIPVLHFFTGTHADYHRPTDTWDKLNIEGMARVSDLVLATCLQIANAATAINFVSLPIRPLSGSRTDRSGATNATYLGSIPDYGVNTNGVALAGVTENSPAARAGLQPGDVIIKLAEKKIQNIEDLTDALRGHRPGDEVEITVLRGGQPVTLKATLRARG
ncbi:MAG TPA: M20/M25/M40 family metallo-hydrolase [Terriglobales bacterium]|nr:M20/M25/M40 family metallo-hydrolase [Terriglobales bacterium]